MEKIFVVEDDDNIREMLIYALNSSGYETVGFASGETVIEEVYKNRPLLILLDIMLPGMDGISILKSLRSNDRHRDIPVIMLTAKTSEIDRIRGLDLGADDYVTKPFSVMEVISRVKAVLRRFPKDTDEGGDIVVEGITLNPDKHTVAAEGEEITLTYKEFELLHYLMLNEGIVLSRGKLLENVWGYDYAGESRTVDMHIKTLRQKLGKSGSKIITVRNVGYKIGG